MKALLTTLFTFAATVAYAETCEKTVAQSPAYSSTLEALELVYAETSWFQKTVFRYKLQLEIEAICDVKLERGKQSVYWLLPSVIKDEEYFKLAISFYKL
jgi:hypothetical protein